MLEWVQKNRLAFERDVLQDFCLASGLLQEQFARFRHTHTLSFPVLRDMIGQPMNKGLLWRLKDKAHHIFLGIGEVSEAGLLLDWTLGYIFHETLKLMEDAHQRQFYAPQLRTLEGEDARPFRRHRYEPEQPEPVRCAPATPGPAGSHPPPPGRTDEAMSPEIAAIAKQLFVILEETNESMRRESARLEKLLLHSRRLFRLYFAGASRHRPLARFLHDRSDLVQSAFREDYPDFLAAVYGNELERLHIEAAHSLLESARDGAAALAIEAALAINPNSADARELKEAHGL